MLIEKDSFASSQMFTEHYMCFFSSFVKIYVGNIAVYHYALLYYYVLCYICIDAYKWKWVHLFKKKNMPWIYSILLALF